MTPSPPPWIPWPRFDRRAYLLLLDEQRRLLVCGGWTVPQVRLTGSADFRKAATRFLGERFGVKDPLYGSVYGIRQSLISESWEFDRVTASRVFIVRVSNTQGAEIERKSATHTRWDIAELRRRRREIYPEGVIALATGYVEGWIPDGPISLP